MKIFYILLLSLLCFSSCKNKDYSTEFTNLFNERTRSFDNKNTKEIAKLLSEWEMNKPKSEKMLMGHVFFYMANSTETNYSDTNKSNSNFRLAQKYLKKCIDQNPQRLDIRAFQINSLLTNKKFNDAITKIETILEVEEKKEKKWLFKKNEFTNHLKSSDTLQGILFTYCSKLYESNDSLIMLKTIEISERMIHLFDNKFRNYLNIGLAFSKLKKNDKALNYFLEAKKIKHNDLKLLFNIADIYTKLKSKNNAIKTYYEIISNGDTNDVLVAKNKLIKLNDSNI